MSDSASKYETIVGLEIHMQLKTASKVFAPDPAHFGAAANEHTSFITQGHPGTLPFLNKQVLEYAVRLTLALNGKVNQDTGFDRKNYFYPDLPKGYQITQDENPICIGGGLRISTSAGSRVVPIHHVHIEEDAGKSIHDQQDDYSLVDLNRAGVPLLELVTEPDLRGAEEADAFIAGIRQLVQYLDICDGNMEEGSLRCDVNISLRPKGTEKLGSKVEIKNMNSLRNIRRAISFEEARQAALLDEGKEVLQQTRGFDANKGITFGQRSKEMAHDYRYFPEPDLQPMHISQAYIDRVKADLPALPWELREKYQLELGLKAYDAEVLTADRAFASYFEELLSHQIAAKVAANWMMGKVKAVLNEKQISIKDFALTPEKLAALISLVESGDLNQLAAQQKLFPALLNNPAAQPAKLAAEMDLMISKDSSVLDTIVAAVISDFPDKVKAYKGGRKGLSGFFMGEVMKRSKGQIDPKSAKEIVLEALDSA